MREMRQHTDVNIPFLMAIYTFFSLWAMVIAILMILKLKTYLKKESEESKNAEVKLSFMDIFVDSPNNLTFDKDYEEFCQMKHDIESLFDESHWKILISLYQAQLRVAKDENNEGLLKKIYEGYECNHILRSEDNGLTRD